MGIVPFPIDISFSPRREKELAFLEYLLSPGDFIYSFRWLSNLCGALALCLKLLRSLRGQSLYFYGLFFMSREVFFLKKLICTMSDAKKCHEEK